MMCLMHTQNPEGRIDMIGGMKMSFGSKSSSLEACQDAQIPVIRFSL